MIIPDRVIRPKEACKILGICRSTLYEWIEIGYFPPQRSIGPRCVGWPSSVVYAWLAARPKA